MKTALVVLLLASTAYADPFAAPKSGVDDIVWAVTASCDKGDDTQQRQCRQIRDRKAKQLAGASLLVEGGGFELGNWDAAKKSVSQKLVACIDCDGFELDGKRWHVAGLGARIDGGKLRGAILHDTAKVFPDQDAAIAWLKPLVGRLRVDYVVKLPPKPRTNVGGKDTIQLEIIAWRVVSPCDGAIVVSNPPTTPLAPDKRACK